VPGMLHAVYWEGQSVRAGTALLRLVKPEAAEPGVWLHTCGRFVSGCLDRSPKHQAVFQMHSSPCRHHTREQVCANSQSTLHNHTWSRTPKSRLDRCTYRSIDWTDRELGEDFWLG
jgi:hypothetical protein